MFKKWFSLTTTISMMLIAACAPVAADEGVVTINSDGSTEESAATTGDSNDQEGSSEPGTGQGGEANPSLPGVQPQQETNIVYTDDTYKFTIAYPADFSFSTQPDEKIANLVPKPLVSFSIMNPIAASSDIVELEPADLEIRIHSAKDATELNRWLTSVGLAGDGYTTQEFKTENVSGLQVCISTMLAPGCSYFVLGSDWVYQMIPSTLEGESILQSFVLLP